MDRGRNRLIEKLVLKNISLESQVNDLSDRLDMLENLIKDLEIALTGENGRKEIEKEKYNAYLGKRDKHDRLPGPRDRRLPPIPRKHQNQYGFVPPPKSPKGKDAIYTAFDEEFIE